MTPRQEALVATCVCGWQTVCLPGDEHGPVTRLLEHRQTWMHGFVPVGRRYQWVCRPSGAHGTLSLYTGARCRCPQCRAVMAAYQRTRRARRAQTHRLLRDAGIVAFEDGKARTLRVLP